MEKWSTFATVSGGAAAGLTGLLFVAVSIRIGALFVTVLFVAILLSIPDQSLRVLGIEVVALALSTGVAMLVLDRRARAKSSGRDDSARDVALILDAVAPNAVTSVLLLVAGVLLVFGLHAGLDVLVLPVITALVGGVVSAWLLLTKIPD